MYVTDAQQSVVQSFLYAPYGDIISEYNTHAMGEAFPKYSFNAKELDEETGMYYYEARYYAPPTFTSRDPLFEKYFWMTPYAYCANNPVKYVDPTGKRVFAYDKTSQKYMKSYFNDQFGTNRIFRFNNQREVKINQKRFNKALVSVNSYQKTLLKGMEMAIGTEKIVKVKVNENSNIFQFDDPKIIGYNDMGFPIYDHKDNVTITYNGEGFTTQKTNISYYMIGINHTAAEEATMTTDVLKKNRKR